MTGVERIAQERATHEARGWTAAHDDEHNHDELAIAAVCCSMYAMGFQIWARNNWPFNEPFKPIKDPIRAHAVAGALLAAEIDRLKRNKARPERCLCNGVGCNSCEPQGRG